MASRKPKLNEIHVHSQVEAYDDIVMAGWAGIAATAELAHRKEAELKNILPADFVEGAKSLRNEMDSILPADFARGEKSLRNEMDVWENGFFQNMGQPVQKASIAVTLSLGKEGVFGGLWNLAAYCEMGLEVFLERIPIRQETVEICEYIDCNPYMADATGSMLFVAARGNLLADLISESGVPASVIGRMMPGRDRVVVNRGERRFLTPPRAAEGGLV